MPRPAYRRIFAALREKILSGECPPGYKFPCERELAKQYGVSQITIRHAMRLLQDHWLVDRRPRIGTVVRPLWPHKKLPISPAEFARSVRRHAPNLRRELLKFERAVPRAYVSEALELPTGQKCLFAERLNWLESQPLALDRVYIPLPLAGSINEETLQRVDFLETWLAQEGLAVSHALREVEAFEANETCVERLGVKPGYPMLLSRDRLCATDGRSLALLEFYFRGDCFKLLVTDCPDLRRRRAASP